MWVTIPVIRKKTISVSEDPKNPIVVYPLHHSRVYYWQLALRSMSSVRNGLAISTLDRTDQTHDVWNFVSHFTGYTTTNILALGCRISPC